MKRKCVDCDGTGFIDGNKCSICDGTGQLTFNQGTLKLKGTYRVKAKFDTSLNDYPRLINSQGKRTSIDPSFNDFYIPCKFGAEIVDGGDNKELGAYIPSLGRGRNIVKGIKQAYGKGVIYDIEELPDANVDKEDRYKFTEKELKGDGSHGEVIFKFKLKDVDKVAEFIEPSTRGATTDPFSKDNLVKNDYIIPEEDLVLYEELKEQMPKITMPNRNGQTYLITSGHAVRTLLSGFNSIIQKKKGKNYDISSEQKLMGLDGEEFIHAIGMWNEFIEYLTEEVKQYTK